MFTQQTIITVKEDLRLLEVGGADDNVVVVEVDDAEPDAKAPQGYTVECNDTLRHSLLE